MPLGHASRGLGRWSKSRIPQPNAVHPNSAGYSQDNMNVVADGSGKRRNQLAKHHTNKAGQALEHHNWFEPGEDKSTSKPNQSLPVGWICAKDDYGRTFYCHDASGHSCWTEPVVVQIPWKYRHIVEHLPHLLSIACDTQWMHITLEAAEDRSKLFSAAYHVVLEEVLNMDSNKRFFVAVQSKHLNQQQELVEGQQRIPTLVETHKRARLLKVSEGQYLRFISSFLRGKPFVFSEAQRISSTETGFSSPRGPKPRTPSACVYYPRTKHPLRLKTSSGGARTASTAQEKARSRSLSPPRRYQQQQLLQQEERRSNSDSTTTQGVPLTMAEFGSLQAKAFREKRCEQLENARMVKDELQSHFGHPANNNNKIAPSQLTTHLPSIQLVIANQENTEETDDTTEQATATLSVADHAVTPPGTPPSAPPVSTSVSAASVPLSPCDSPPAQEVAGFLELALANARTKQLTREMTVMERNMERVHRKDDSRQRELETVRSQLANTKVSYAAILTRFKQREKCLVDKLEVAQADLAYFEHDVQQHELDCLQEQDGSAGDDKILRRFVAARKAHYVASNSERVERTALNRQVVALHSEALGLAQHLQEHDLDQADKADKVDKADKDDHIENDDKVRRGEKPLLVSPIVEVREEVKDEEDFEEEQRLAGDAGATAAAAASRPTVVTDHLTLQVAQQANHADQLEKELFDAKCSLSRLSQRLKQSENESAVLRNEHKMMRQQWAERERQLESRAEDAFEQLRHTTASLQAARVDRDAVDRGRKESAERTEVLRQQVDDLHAELASVEQLRAQASDTNAALERTHALAIAARQREMEEYRTGLKHHYARCRQVWEADHASEVRRAKEQHASELEGLRNQARQTARQVLEEQRHEFMARIESLQTTHKDKTEQLLQEAQQAANENEKSHATDARHALDAAVRAERKRSEALLAESYVQREVEAVKFRRASAVALLHNAIYFSHARTFGNALMLWQRFVAAQKADELVEVYGAAMDQTNAAAKLSLICAKLYMRLRRRAFDKWRSSMMVSGWLNNGQEQPPQIMGTMPTLPVSLRTIPSETQQPLKLDFFVRPMYPSELARKVRKLVPNCTVLYAKVDDLVESLDVNLDGKVNRDTFDAALRKCTGEHCRITAALNLARSPTHNNIIDEIHPAPGVGFCLAPSMNWKGMAISALSKLAFWSSRRVLLVKARAWAKWLIFTATAIPRRGEPRLSDSDFLREVETQALQEEVRALHAQLGASKAEAWKYKRKVLLNYIDKDK